MSVCVSPIKGTVLRMVKLDACGVPVTGASGKVVVSDGFVQVGQSPQYEEGDEFLQRNAAGALCINEKDPDLLKRITLTVDLCTVDPEMMELALTVRLLSIGSPLVTGAGFALKEGASANHYSLEVWQRIAGAGACTPGGLQQYLYNAWPNVGNGRLGDHNIANEPSTIQFVGDTFAPSTLWGDGPGTGTSWITPATVAAGEHWLAGVTTTAPPTSGCGSTLLT